MEYVQMREGPGATREPITRNSSGIPLAKTASYSVLESDLFAGVSNFSNAGAGGAVTFSLPILTAKYNGMRVSFRRDAAQNVVIDAPAGTLLKDAAAASSDGGTLTASTTTEKAFIELEYYHPDWFSRTKIGTWAAA